LAASLLKLRKLLRADLIPATATEEHPSQHPTDNQQSYDDEHPRRPAPLLIGLRRFDGRGHGIGAHAPNMRSRSVGPLGAEVPSKGGRTSPTGSGAPIGSHLTDSRSMPAMPTGYAVRVGLLLSAWMALTGILIAVGFGVVHSSTVAAFDRHVTSTVVTHRSPVLNSVMKALTWLGSWVALVIAGVVVLVLAVRGRLVWLAVVFAVLAWAGETGGVQLAKHVVARQRPPEKIWLKTAHGWSWPSGHMAAAVVVFTVLALVVTHVFSSRATLIAAWTFAIVAMALVGFSRIELGVHWTTDVLASFVFVSLWLLAIVTLFTTELKGTQTNPVP